MLWVETEATQSTLCLGVAIHPLESFGSSWIQDTGLQLLPALSGQGHGVRGAPRQSLISPGPASPNPIHTLSRSLSTVQAPLPSMGGEGKQKEGDRTSSTF